MNDLGDRLLQGLNDAIAHLRGEEVAGLCIRSIAAVPDEIGVAAIPDSLVERRKPLEKE